MELVDFIDAVRDRRVPRVSGEDGRRALAGTDSRQLVVWDIEERKEILPRIQADAIPLGIAATPDGRRVFYVLGDWFRTFSWVELADGEFTLHLLDGVAATK